MRSPLQTPKPLKRSQIRIPLYRFLIILPPQHLLMTRNRRKEITFQTMRCSVVVPVDGTQVFEGPVGHAEGFVVGVRGGGTIAPETCCRGEYFRGCGGVAVGYPVPVPVLR